MRKLMYLTLAVCLMMAGAVAANADRKSVV